jgi:hypothetical protein
MTQHRCSECSRVIGFIEGLFKCPRSGEVAHCVPKERVPGKTIKISKQYLGEDLSHRAIKRAKVNGK